LTSKNAILLLLKGVAFFLAYALVSALRNMQPGRANTNQRIVVVMPAYNAARTLKLTYDDLPHELIDNIILVDDGSEDATVGIARSLNLKIFIHDRNRGYGANQKTCYTEALNDRATIIVMVHPDYQYDPTLLADIVEPIQDDRADVVLGSRMMGHNAYRQGMPWWKFLGNRILTGIENTCFGLNLSEYHTGYRAYRSAVLETIDFHENSDGFVFDQEVIAQIVRGRFRIAEVSVPVRYFPEASSIGFIGSAIYGFRILSLLVRFLASNGRSPVAVPG
jgi:glycosyltransferase involved in cell wall biosynthesis